MVSGHAPGDHTRKAGQKIPNYNRKRSDSYASFSGHPAATRASLVQAAQDMALATSPPKRKSLERLHLDLSPDGRVSSRQVTISEENHVTSPQEVTENTPLLHPPSEGPEGGSRNEASSEDSHTTDDHEREHGHNHDHSHSESGSMNMRALLLHVLGDALGNVGVIATGLIIWLTSWSFKYYCDPIISLIITFIIFSSALPLGKNFVRLMAQPFTNWYNSSKYFVHSIAGCPIDRLNRGGAHCNSSGGWSALCARIAHLAAIRIQDRCFCSCHGFTYA